ncbi:MAG: DNA internalization-related competence protein ComEC/Rec2 [Candidatus Competibacteraceae bacterium]
MRLGALALLCGMLLFHSLAEAPDRHWIWALPGVLALGYYLPCLRLPAWGLAGFLWALWRSEPLLLSQLPSELEGADLRVSGWVASIPFKQQHSTRFLLTVDTLYRDDTVIPFHGQLRLNWYDPSPPLQVGDHWELTVRLHRPRGPANPGGFDREQWLYSIGVAAIGQVRHRPAARLLQPAARYPLDRLRQRLAADFARFLPDSPYVGILTALAIGDQQGIPQQQWNVFTRTGTGHLISVSGLHIGMVAGLIFGLIRFCWGWLPAPVQRWPVTKVAALLALLAAGIYSLLSGLSLPTQRSWVMLAVALLALFAQRAVVPSRILALALIAVLIGDPTAPLNYGFWLSFGAVAAILYAVSGRRLQAPLREWLSLQIAITLALLPLTLLLFKQIPLLAPPANLVAIPWTTVTVVPLTLVAALVGGISSTLEGWLLQLAALTLDWLWRFLVWLGASPWALIYWPAPPLWVLIFALPGLLWLLAPRGMPARWLGAVLLLPLLFPPTPEPAPGEVWLTLLDVDQGLAAVVRTARHVLIYDTGPRRGGLDAGRQVLVPYLRQEGIRQVDTLILSQADNAHLGGARSLLEQYTPLLVLTPSTRAIPVEGAEPCQVGREWTWDEVRFQILHPPTDSPFSGADNSCVLLVSGKQRLLLPGAIGAPVADTLAQSYSAGLTADILVAPKHELPPTFVAAVKPHYVLFAGDRPRSAAAYRASGATVLDTASGGGISFHPHHNGELQPELYRQQRRRYWQLPVEEE